MAQECPLRSPLVVKDLQSGFAGETGTVFTIDEDCRFTIVRQVGSTMSEPVRTGQLAPQLRTQLKEVLIQTAIADLPAELGSRQAVNPRRISISYEGKDSVLTLPASMSDLRGLLAEASNDAARRLLALASTVTGMIGN